jgi:hypothetical protein
MANVNGLQLDGAAAGLAPAIAALGSDTDIDVRVASKGLGILRALGIGGDGAPMKMHRSAIAGAKADTNIVLGATEYDGIWINLGWTGWTGAHNVVVPLTADAVWIITNGTGYAATIIGATGTGIAIANGKTALVGCDGTNIVRLTADA